MIITDSFHPNPTLGILVPCAILTGGSLLNSLAEAEARVL